MLSEEAKRYRELSGDTNPHTPISRIGGYLDGYERALGKEPCSDCISREDALMALTGEWTEPTDELIHRFIRRIRKLPPVTVEPKTATLDKIRAEIEAKCCITVGRENDGAITLHDVFEIIDKYKAEGGKA